MYYGCIKVLLRMYLPKMGCKWDVNGTKMGSKVLGVDSWESEVSWNVARFIGCSL